MQEWEALETLLRSAKPGESRSCSLFSSTDQNRLVGLVMDPASMPDPEAISNNQQPQTHQELVHGLVKSQQDQQLATEASVQSLTEAVMELARVVHSQGSATVTASTPVSALPHVPVDASTLVLAPSEEEGVDMENHRKALEQAIAMQDMGIDMKDEIEKIKTNMKRQFAAVHAESMKAEEDQDDNSNSTSNSLSMGNSDIPEIAKPMGNDAEEETQLGRQVCIDIVSQL